LISIAVTVGGQPHRGVQEVPRSERQTDQGTLASPVEVTSNGPAWELLSLGSEGIDSMSVVRILGFSTLTCGCVVGRYRDIASTREVTYVEEKGVGCESHAHRRNHTVSAERERFAAVSINTLTARAS
jgi:hypothetical protein